MALSTYYVSQRRKDLAERAIVAKREKEANKDKRCEEVASFHREMARKSSKYKFLEDAKTLNTPRMQEESYVLEERKAAAKEKIEYRRQKLAHILDVENKQFMKELEEMKDKNCNGDPFKISNLKKNIEDIQKQRKEIEQNMQKRYTCHVFSARACSPSSEKEGEILEKQVLEAWQERKQELERLSLEKRQKEEERLRQMQAEKEDAEHVANEVETLHSKEQENWSIAVESKINELNAADNESKKLSTEKGILVEHLELLLSLKQKREAVRDIHRKAYKKIQNIWQPNERMRKMLNEVKHGLEFDLKMLSSLVDMNNSAAEDSALALMNLDEAAEVREKVEMQIALERERELEVMHLYQEEASRIWDDKREQWMLELVARDEIINELIKSLVNQINKKVDNIVCEEKKLNCLKENILLEMENINMQTKDCCKTLESKHRYYVYQVDKLDEVLQSKSCIA